MTPPILFKDWLPDQPSLGNPGLTEALNMMWVGGSYVPYLPLSGLSTATSQQVLKAYRASGEAGSELYVATSDITATSHLYVGTGVVATSWTDRSPSTTLSGVNRVSFAQYDELVIATNFANDPVFRTLGSTSDFQQLTSSTGSAPQAAVAGRIGQFILLGNLSGDAPYAAQWSGIDDITSWPTPGSTTAIAQQAGKQYMDANYGRVIGVGEGDQWGLLLLDGALVRVTYVGGNDVFQFDTIYKGPGPIDQNSWVKIGGMFYFASPAGFFATDGVQVIPIGVGKVDNYFLSNLDSSNGLYVHAGVHYTKRLVYWTYPKTGNSGVPNDLLIYNYEERKWTHANDGVRVFVPGDEALFATYGVEAFNTSNKAGHFSGFAATASAITGELELNTGGLSYVRGVKPLVPGINTTSPTVTLKSRNDLTSTQGASSAVTPNSRTGVSNFREDAARYHQFQVDVSGSFTALIGLELDAVATGNV